MKERDRPVLIGIDEIFTSLFARPGAATLRPRCVAFVAGGGKLGAGEHLVCPDIVLMSRCGFNVQCRRIHVVAMSCGLHGVCNTCSLMMSCGPCMVQYM
jgi:hypothetical protein